MPTNALVISAAMNGPVSSGMSGPAMCGAAASASDAAMPAFTETGIMRVLNGGDTKSHAAARTNASANAVSSTGSKANVMRSESIAVGVVV